jgi:probable phosphoglycerate mutase
MRLYIVRHGQTVWNAQSRAQGHTDIPLDDCGVEQAALLARSFSPGSVDAIYASDLQRCFATAEVLAMHVGTPVIVDKRLRERTFGDWEGFQFDRIRELVPPNNSLHFRPPNGESLYDTWQRVKPVASELEQLTLPTVVVTHGGIGALLLSALLKGNCETARSFRFGNTGLVELEKRPDGFFALIRYNDTSHLGSKALIGGPDGISR